MSVESNLYASYERHLIETYAKPKLLPCMLLTGFLGSGKTTVLKHIIDSKHNLRIGAVVNDYAEHNVDTRLLDRSAADKLVGLQGNCLCCPISDSSFQDCIWELLGGNSHGKPEVDYLVIETSGVATPESIIDKLDRRFGKFTRARLDCVVSVIDTDLLTHSLGGGGAESLGQAFHRQIVNADICVLNKVDLVSEEGVANAREYIQSVNPGCTVLHCSYGKLALDQLLDLEVSAEANEVVSHEARVGPHFTVGDGQGLRAVSNRRAAGGATPASGHSHDGHGHDHVHTANDGLTSVSVQVPGSIPLATLQQLLEKVSTPSTAENGDDEDACLAWGSVLARMKGVLCIREFPLARVNLSVSGRCRIQLDDDGTWQTAPQCTLVGIGRFHENQAKAQTRLTWWLAEAATAAAAAATEQGDAAAADSSALLGELESRILADNRFDVLPPKSGICRIQLTCAKMLHHDVFTIHTRHGVDFERVNRALAEAVNMRTIEHGQTVLFIHTDDADNGVDVCVAFSANSRDPLRTWEVVQQQADAIVQRYFSHIHSCSCGL